ncbi:hypothetical protein MF1_10120 [Bartonella quintana]|nr:hypothetical protein MF1_10120 [Bartonella quintana]
MFWGDKLATHPEKQNAFFLSIYEDSKLIIYPWSSPTWVMALIFAMLLDKQVTH